MTALRLMFIGCATIATFALVASPSLAQMEPLFAQKPAISFSVSAPREPVMPLAETIVKVVARVDVPGPLVCNDPLEVAWAMGEMPFYASATLSPTTSSPELQHSH